MSNQHFQDFEKLMKERLAVSTAFAEGNLEPLKQISVEKSPATIFGPNGKCIQGVENVNVVNA